MADLEIHLSVEQLKKNPYIKFDDKDKIYLPIEQQQQIVDYWNRLKDNPPSIAAIIEHIYKEPYDVRSKVGMVIRKFLEQKSLKQNPKTELVLTEAQKAYVIENAKNMGLIKLAEQLFPEVKMTALTREFIVVNNYVKSLDPKITGINVADEGGDYNPPKQIRHAAYRVNKYTYDQTIKDEEWLQSTTIKNCLESLIKFCHHPRFILLASRFTKKRERELFEGSFIGYVWDKIDLSKEEIDLYIDLCQDIVDELRLNEEIEIHSEMLSNTAEDAENRKISVSISDHIKNLRDEISKNKVRRQKSIENLQGKRSERIEARRQENDSLLHLVDYIKVKENRTRMAKTLEVRQKKLIDETKRLENMDDLILEIYGITPEEIIFGKI